MLVLDFSTGEMVEVVSNHAFEGKNLQDAQKSLNASNISYVRLSGREVEVTVNNEKEVEAVEQVTDAYESMIDPVSFVSDMTIDEFCDWLQLGSEEDVKATLRAFEKCDLPAHISIIKGHLKSFYGN